ncbi:hypothetical protein B0H10DRAFT_1783239, partial [Mycena sp. CBHHK59/15]
KCQICTLNESKYTCSTCAIVYCSVPCYKKHKGAFTQTDPPSDGDPLLVNDGPPLRLLTDLKWLYIPKESAYPDPLKRDDPKPLQTHQYEAIATSQTIRTSLAEHPNLPGLLTSIDKPSSPDREAILQRMLAAQELSKDVLALHTLAVAVEAAVWGGKDGALGLDWGE